MLIFSTRFQSYRISQRFVHFNSHKYCRLEWSNTYHWIGSQCKLWKLIHIITLRSLIFLFPSVLDVAFLKPGFNLFSCPLGPCEGAEFWCAFIEKKMASFDELSLVLFWVLSLVCLPLVLGTIFKIWNEIAVILY